MAFTTETNLADLDGSNGSVVHGISEGDRAGRSVSGAGDVNGDGFEDLIIGAPAAGNQYEGASYIVFGSSGGDKPRSQYRPRD